MRLDLFLTTNEYCESRNKASSLIKNNMVTVNGKTAVKPSMDIKDDDIVAVSDSVKQYVARSAHKLITAISVFKLDFADKTAVDLGASTGGFCEVMLDNNVGYIYAVDIGTNQLHPRISASEKVKNIEHTNARYINAQTFDREIDLITCDLSFISLKLILGAVYDTLKTGGEFICLVKPQFEVGPDLVNKNGVVKDLGAHVNAVNDVIRLAEDTGFSVIDVSFSGLEGESGNKEYLLYMLKEESQHTFDTVKVVRAVYNKNL